MDRTKALETFISNWNNEFGNCPLKVGDLSNPQSVITALLEVFERLGIDKDAVLAPPPEEDRNEHTMYYWDLLPVINLTRVYNHLISVESRMDPISINCFLQPTPNSSHSILLFLFNLIVFNEVRLQDISPFENELFAKTKEVTELESKKNKLLVSLNQQAEEKAMRAERLMRLDHDIKRYEEELKQEKEFHDKEKQNLDIILKENKQLQMLFEQKKAQLDALHSEIAKKRALIVYDAEDIKAKAEQAAQNVQEAEEKINSLRTTHMQKENSLKNLQTLKPSLDIANNLLKEISRAVESLKEIESGDLDSDMKESELNLLNTDLTELQGQLGEVQTAREEAAVRRQESQAKRQQEKAMMQSTLREAEEKDKKCKENSKRAQERIEEIKKRTLEYDQEKMAGINEIAKIKNNFEEKLKEIEELLIKKALEAKKRVSDKLKERETEEESD